MFSDQSLTLEQVQAIPLKLLALLGDAIWHVFVREQEILLSYSSAQMHCQTAKRASAANQAIILDNIKENLTDCELEIVRRARNIKPAHYRKAGQNAYRKSTAFEALLGYLYLSDVDRLIQVLGFTQQQENNKARK